MFINLHEYLRFFYTNHHFYLSQLKALMHGFHHEALRISLLNSDCYSSNGTFDKGFIIVLRLSCTVADKLGIIVCPHSSV